MKSILVNLLLLSHLFLVSHSIGNGFFILKDLNCDNFNLLKVKRKFFFFIHLRFLPDIEDLPGYHSYPPVVPRTGCWKLEGWKLGQDGLPGRTISSSGEIWNLAQTSVTLWDVVGILAKLANSLEILSSEYELHPLFLLFWEKLKVIYYLSTIYDQLLSKCGRGIRKSLRF